MAYRRAEEAAPADPLSADEAGAAPASTDVAPARGTSDSTRRHRYTVLTTFDRVVLVLMVGVPLAIFLAMIWGSTIVSLYFSFTAWRGVGDIQPWVALRNYQQLFDGTYPFFWPALQHNIIWLAFLMFIATPLGIFLAVLLDGQLRATRFYQTVFYLPVVLSLAVIGIIWQLQYATGAGFIDQVLRQNVDWYGDSSLNLWAALIAASWRHVGYITILYLAGLKSFDPALREAAAIDGANARQTFFRVVFPVMQPINTVIVVITTIEAFRAFDLAYIINGGRNGLELLSTDIVNTALSESTRVGFGSAIAIVLLVISLGPICVFLIRQFRGETA